MIIKCLSCGKEKKTYRSRVNNGFGKYCSYKCSNKGKVPNNYLNDKQKILRLKNLKKSLRNKDIRNKISILKMGDKNPIWGGDTIGYTAVHQWVNRNIKKLKICSVCGVDKNIDLANITGVYNRDFINWDYLCRSDHMKSDGRLKNLHKNRLKYAGIQS